MPLLQIVSATVQHMFPALDVANIKLAQCRRVVLLHLDKETGHMEWRHYAITAVPIGLSRSVKRIVQAKIPDLSRVDDIRYALKAPM